MESAQSEWGRPRRKQSSPSVSGGLRFLMPTLRALDALDLRDARRVRTRLDPGTAAAVPPGLRGEGCLLAPFGTSGHEDSGHSRIALKHRLKHSSHHLWEPIPVSGLPIPWACAKYQRHQGAITAPSPRRPSDPWVGFAHGSGPPPPGSGEVIWQDTRPGAPASATLRGAPAPGPPWRR